MGINYWFNWAITIAAEISAAVIIMQYWFPNGSALLFSTIFFFSILLLNLFSVRIYGEVEYLLSMMKVVTIVVFIILGAILILKTPDFGLHNMTISDGPFHAGLGGFFAVFLAAGFSFQGSELIGISSGEARDPEKSIPKAVKSVFWRLLMFYILATLVISLLIPFNDKSLMSQDSVNASPFTLVFAHYIPGGIAANILNFVILVAILSAANASMYSATRTLWYMSHTNQAPRIFSKVTSYGLPINALIATALVGSTVFLSSLISNGALFTKLVNISSSCGFIAWFGIALCHYCFRKKFIKDLSILKYKAILFPVGPIFSMLFIAFIILGQGYSLYGDFSISGFFDAYGSLFFFFIFMIYYKFFRKNNKTVLGNN